MAYSKFKKSICMLAILSVSFSGIQSFAFAGFKDADEINPADYKCPVIDNDNMTRVSSYSSKNRQMIAKPSLQPIPSYAIAPLPPPPPPVIEQPPISPSQTKSNSNQNNTAEMVVVTGVKSNGNIKSEPNLNTEKYPSYNLNSFKQVKSEPVSTFAMETDTASYANTRRFINEGRLPPTESVRVEEFLNYFEYDYKKPKDTKIPFSTNVTIAPSPWSKEKQLIKIGLQGYDIDKKRRDPLNLVLLMDVSGSMSGEDRLPLAKRAIYSMLPKLNANDKVSIVVYAGAAGVVLNPTKADNKQDIVCAIEAMQAGGSTAGGQGIALAYKLAAKARDRNSINRVILMTDGDFNVGISDKKQLQDFVAKEKEKNIYLSVFGFGHQNYNDELMQALAQNGNGIASYIDNIGEAKRILNKQFAGAMFPIANDVKAQIEFNPDKVSEYRLIGYETRALNREDFNNDKIDAGEIGSGHQISAIYEITLNGQKATIDELRYSNDNKIIASNTNEIAYLKIRYKLPNETVSKLISRPITNSDYASSASEFPNDTKFALAVAAFAQKLRQDPWADISYDQIISLAQDGLEYDDYGQRKEFIELVNEAKTLSNLPE